MQNTTFFPPSTCFLCSLDRCTLFIQLCLDISENKSWILQSRFHCFLLKLSQTIAQGEGFHTHPGAKSRIYQDSLQTMRINANIFPQLNPTFYEVNSTRSKAAPVTKAPSPQPAGISLVSACYSSTDSRAERGETRSIHDSLTHVVMIPEGRSKRYGSNTNPG